MKILKNIQEIIKKAKALDLKSLEALKYTLFVFVVADLFGVYWYLNIKKLGIALLMVMIVALSVILILERRLNDKMEENKTEEKEEEKKEEKEEKEESKEESSFDLGLPSAEEYQKKTEEAFGTL